MTWRRDFWLLLPRQIRALPADLAAVLALVVLTNLSIVLPVVSETPLRVLLGLPFVLFIPGYAFIAALFPEAGSSPVEDAAEEPEDADSRRGIDGIERVALSFGLSIAIVPLIGLVLNFTPWGIRLVPILISVSLFTVLSVAVAAHRRWELPADERFAVPYEQWLTGAKTELFEPDTRVDLALNVLLVFSILLAVSSVAYAVAVPKQGETFTEFYLLTENESDELVAADYPTNFTQGESKSVIIGIGNHEHETVQYSVIVELHRVESTTTNNSTNVTVLEETELQRFQPQVAHNDTWHQPYDITPTMVGDRLRLTFLLYKDAPPAEPTIDTAYRELHLWINVSRAP